MYSSWQLIKDIWNLLKPYRLKFLFASFIRLIGDLVWLYPAFAFASLITFLTTYEEGASLRPLWILLGLWVAAIIIRSLCQFFTKYLGYLVAERIAIDSALATIQHMFRLDMVWHERENSGNKIKRIQNAGEGFNKILRLWFNNIIEITVNLVAINIIIAQFDRTVMVSLIVFLLTYFLISGVMTKRAGKAAKKVNKQEEHVNGLLFESINNIRTVKVMSMGQALYSTLTTETRGLFEKIGLRIFWYQSRNAFLSFWAHMFKIGITVIVIRGILQGNYEVGFLVLFHSYFADLRGAIDELSMASIEFITSKLSIERMQRILQEPIVIEREEGKVPFPRDWKNISVRNVSFSYGVNEVLHDISFEVRRGEKVGIVGLSGAGKSTLLKLLLKEREEFNGDILLDDISIKDIQKSDYFEDVSVVLQDTEVFNFSLKENITITNSANKGNEQLLEQAIRTAHISELLTKLPKGLNTLIGEKGIKLSGGERQRLGIARAIFKKPQILLLDEATSHLDLESEEKIRDSLHAFFENVTAIIIAHRLTTIKEMDKILVIEDGKIIESGNFDELYAKGGRFHELWEKQRL